jgi:hypothetical protein
MTGAATGVMLVGSAGLAKAGAGSEAAGTAAGSMTGGAATTGITAAAAIGGGGGITIVIVGVTVGVAFPGNAASLRGLSGGAEGAANLLSGLPLERGAVVRPASTVSAAATGRAAVEGMESEAGAATGAAALGAATVGNGAAEVTSLVGRGGSADAPDCGETIATFGAVAVSLRFSNAATSSDVSVV